MPDPFTTGSEGERILAERLRGLGRTVSPSDRRTFDLVVDQTYAEVKSSRQPYAQLGFVGLTHSQQEALQNGPDFILFLVCNLADPGHEQIFEVRSSDLRSQKPTIEPTYYYKRTQLDGITRPLPGTPP
jgi:hypothetical protein